MRHRNRVFDGEVERPAGLKAVALPIGSGSFPRCWDTQGRTNGHPESYTKGQVFCFPTAFLPQPPSSPERCQNTDAKTGFRGGRAYSIQYNRGPGTFSRPDLSAHRRPQGFKSSRLPGAAHYGTGNLCPNRIPAPNHIGDRCSYLRLGARSFQEGGRSAERNCTATRSWQRLRP